MMRHVQVSGTFPALQTPSKKTTKRGGKKGR